MANTSNYPSLLNKPTDCIAGVGTNIQNLLAKLNINTVFHLLLHLPRDYEDRSTVFALSAVQDGQSKLFEGHITHLSKNNKGKTKLVATFSDGTAEIRLVFFKVYPSLTQKLQIGNQLRIFGEVKYGRFGMEMAHPELTTVSSNTPLPKKQLTPVYSTTKGLTQNKLRNIIKMAFKALNQQAHCGISEFINPHFADKCTLFDALNALHFPNAQENIDNLLNQHPARQRIKLEELTCHQLSFLIKKQQHQSNKAPRCIAKSELAVQLLNNLPFQLTNAQQKVIAEIINDISTSLPMLRLVQGDVGSGKTLVSAIAACHAIDAGWQVALVAPTEILAEQHFQNFKDWFEPLNVSVAWLAGKVPAKQKRETLAKIADGDVQLIIGTHALFQQSVQYAKLGLIIIDEQHRFGVAQRIAMRDKGVGTPHQLVMTATPIPRTLAMSAYGDMDTSVIDELPPGRTPVTTLTISEERRAEVIDRIATNCMNGKQAYWVCPLVEDSEALSAAAAESTFAMLEDQLSIPVGLVHGKMKADEKQAVMEKFYQNEIKLLVATTVIEVGVNVPNASLMVIENAERLGLSQLHQLRGRVGRGSEKSYCVLMYKKPLSENGQARLGVMKQSNDGFYIAEQDLLLRGPGELIGKRQSGNIGFYVANLQIDQELLPLAKQIAKNIVADDLKNQTDVAKKQVTLWLGTKDYHNV